MLFNRTHLVSLVKRDRAAIIIFGLVGLLILGPLLLPGYVLTLDMSWPPEWKFPEQVANGYPLYMLLATLNKFISSTLLQKLMLWGVFFVASFSTYLLARHLHLVTRTPYKIAAGYFASLLYAVNPFTYDRLMDGQWLVLIGYALLPVFALALLRLLERNTIRRAIELAAVTIAVSYTSIHMMYMLLLIAAVPVAVSAYRLRSQKSALIKQVGGFVAIAAVTLLANSFWLFPGNGLGMIGTFDMRHILTFRSVGDGFLNVPLNLLTLGGYWGEAQDRFMTAKSVVPLWPIFFLGIFALVIIGTKTLWKRSRSIAVTFLSIGVVGWAIAVGVSAPGFREAFTWLTSNLPFFQGYREPQKFIALLVLAYAVLGSFGVSSILTYLRTRKYHLHLTAVVVALPFMYTPTLLWGGFGQLRAVDYPSDWYALRENLLLESPTPTALFLPWHQYLYLDFAGRTVASPGSQFFGSPIIESTDPSLGLIQPTKSDKTTEIIERHVLKGETERDTIGQTLMQIGVKYIVVSKTADWRTYDYLQRERDLTLISDTTTLLVYRNNNMR